MRIFPPELYLDIGEKEALFPMRLLQTEDTNPGLLSNFQKCGGVAVPIPILPVFVDSVQSLSHDRLLATP